MSAPSRIASRYFTGIVFSSQKTIGCFGGDNAADGGGAVDEGDAIADDFLHRLAKFPIEELLRSFPSDSAKGKGKEKEEASGGVLRCLCFLCHSRSRRRCRRHNTIFGRMKKL